MPDIQLRFHNDMLVLSAPIDAVLDRQGIDAALDRQYLNIMEPDAICDALRLEVAAGAQCVVTTTEDITQARLAHVRMEADAPRLAQAALAIANGVKPQHVLAEIGPCGLPLDPSSKASLNENRSQYAAAARAFEGGTFDALFLNGFANVADLKCALMGVAQVSDKPVFASVVIGAADETHRAQGGAAPQSPDGASGGDELLNMPFAGGYALVADPVSPPLPAASRRALDPQLWPQAIEAMTDLGAAVVGFETAEPISSALAYAETAVALTDRPLLAQLRVSPDEGNHAARNLVPLADVREYTPDTMAPAAVKLYGAGVQFVRATGAATPAFTGALAATLAGLDVRAREDVRPPAL